MVADFMTKQTQRLIHERHCQRVFCNLLAPIPLELIVRVSSILTGLFFFTSQSRSKFFLNKNIFRSPFLLHFFFTNSYPSSAHEPPLPCTNSYPPLPYTNSYSSSLCARTHTPVHIFRNSSIS
jgi:hypothetical protein